MIMILIGTVQLNFYWYTIVRFETLNFFFWVFSDGI